MKQILSRATALVALALLAACTDSPVAPVAAEGTPAPTASLAAAANMAGGATRTLYPWVDVLDGVRIGCWDGDIDDVVELSGTLYLRTQELVTPQGDLHIVSHVMPVDVAGVGLDTGDRYRVQVKEHSVFHEREAANVYLGSSRYLLLMTGETNGATFKVEFRSHFRMDENGGVSRDRFEFNCWI